MKKAIYELRQVDAYMYDDSWAWNTSYHLKNVKTTNPKVYLRNFIRNTFISPRGFIVVTFDGDIWTAHIKETGEPVMALIPEF